MPSRKPQHRFQDILDNADRIMRYTAGMTAATFAQDEKTIDAVERCLGRITEAAIKLEGLAEVLAPDQPWRRIRAFGNVLRHDYDSLDLEGIWRIIEQDLPALRDACANALRRLEAEGR